MWSKWPPPRILITQGWLVHIAWPLPDHLHMLALTSHCTTDLVSLHTSDYWQYTSAILPTRSLRHVALSPLYTRIQLRIVRWKSAQATARCGADDTPPLPQEWDCTTSPLPRFFFPSLQGLDTIPQHYWYWYARALSALEHLEVLPLFLFLFTGVGYL